jgi:Chaperone of endosialidase
MRYILILLLFISGAASAQFAPTSAKTKFVNGIAIGSRDTSQFTAADTIALTIARDSVMYYRYRGFWRPIATGGNLSAYKLISDTLFNNGYTTRARLKQGLDSLAATKVNISDTAAMLAPYFRDSDTTGLLNQVVRTFGAQTVFGIKSFGDSMRIGAGLSVLRIQADAGISLSQELNIRKNTNSLSTDFLKIGTSVGSGTLYGSYIKSTSNHLSFTGNDMVLGVTNTSGNNVDAISISSAGVTSINSLSTAGIVTNTSAGVLGTTSIVPIANGGTGSSTQNFVDLTTSQTITGQKTFNVSGNSGNVIINHGSGSGVALNITKGGNGEGLIVNKTSGSGNAATIIGTLNATALVKSGGTSSQFLMADGSVNTSVLPSGAYLPLSGGTLTGGLSGTTLTMSGLATFDNGTDASYLNSASFGFNRNVANGVIKNSGGFAYQWQKTNSTTAANDELALQLYNPSGGFVNYPITFFGNGNTTIGGSVIVGGTIRSNASTGFAVGEIASYRRLQYNNGTTTFSFLRDDNGLANAELGALNGTSAAFSGGVNMATSSGNVGIGTTSPVVALDFGNVTGKSFHLYSSAGDFYGINMVAYDGSTFSTNIFSGDGGLIKFRTASGTSTQSTRMTINAVGNVLLGTTTDNGADRLQVNGSGRFTSSNSTNLSVVRTGANNVFMSLADASGNIVFLGNNGGDFRLQTASGGYTDKLVIANSGAATFSSSIAATSAAFSGAVTAIDAGNTYSGRFGGNSGTPNIVAIGTKSDNVANINGYTSTFSATRPLALQADGGNLLLGTTTDNGNRLQVSGGGTFTTGVNMATSSGNVGIGTTSPGYKLDIINSNVSDADIFRAGMSGVSNGFEIRRVSSNFRYIFNDGNVGIGTTSPSTALHVIGAATFSSSVTATGFIVSSDKRLKNILSRSGDMVTYTLKNDNTKQLHYGYIAQEVEKVLPTTVSTDNNGIKAVNYIEVLVKKVNDLEKKIEQLEKLLNK